MIVQTRDFGKTSSGKTVTIFTMRNSHGCQCSLISYGAAVQELFVPDKHGKLSDVVLGFDDFAGYESPQNPYFGATIGRHGNRIEDACFTLNGKTYQLARNDGRNNLHGGPGGFGRVVWEGKVVSESDEPAVAFSYHSPDGEEGFPGTMETIVTYTLTKDNGLRIEYDAVADRTTVINLTNHTYFNLAGHNRGSVLEHVLQIDADEVTVGNSELLPDGTFASVEGTSFDFRKPKSIGRDIDSDEEQLRFGGGYDHNFVLRSKSGELARCARVYELNGFREMTVETTLPGLQLYTGNMMKRVIGKGGAAYDYRHGFCLETQFYPNSLRHPHFPSPVFEAGEHFRHTTVYRFGVLTFEE